MENKVASICMQPMENMDVRNFFGLHLHGHEDLAPGTTKNLPVVDVWDIVTFRPYLIANYLYIHDLFMLRS